MKCPKCKCQMEVNVEKKAYICENCGNMVRWNPPENVSKIRSFMQF